MTNQPEFVPPIAAVSSNLSINHFQKLLIERTLVLRPAFQRNLVWNAEQQSFLVDTILRGLPVPEIYIQTSVSADGDEETVVVDGQQRITACLKFLNDRLRLVNEQDLDGRWRSKLFSELSEPLKRRFRGFELIVRKLPELDEAVLREVFRRLNKTVEPLEAQELRHAAYTGPFVKFVELAAAQPVFSDIGVFSAKDYQRRRNDEFLAEVSYAVVTRAYPNKKEGLDELFLTYERQGMPEGSLEDLERRFGRIFAELPNLAFTLRRSRFKNKSDFYSLLVFLATRADHLPLSSSVRDRLLNAIREFSDRVNGIKREEGVGVETPLLASGETGAQAAKYLRAVERAASDRLNRVRRDEALAYALGPILDDHEPRKLEARDAAWTSVPVTEDTVEDDFGDVSARQHVQDVLLSEPLDALNGDGP